MWLNGMHFDTAQNVFHVTVLGAQKKKKPFQFDIFKIFSQIPSFSLQLPRIADMKNRHEAQIPSSIDNQNSIDH